MFKRGAALIALVAALAAGPSLAVAADSDHDGLPNSWEKGKTPKGLNVKKLGASPKHRDVFVQLDYAKGGAKASDISCGALTSLVKAYAGGPLANPDGKQGIRLHIDAGKKCPGHNYDLGGSRTFKVGGPCASFNDVGNGLAAKRLPVFHLGAVVSDAQLCGAEGEAADTDFIVKTRGGGNDFAYVVMHELGHVFGLVHGISNDAEVPVDKFSVMSGSLKYGNGTAASVLDYQRYPMPVFHESSLSETAGFSTGDPPTDHWLSQFWSKQYCLESGDQRLEFQSKASGPIDFDCEGAPFWGPADYSTFIDADPVSYDINGDGQIDDLPAVPAEWPKLKLGNGRIGG